VFDLKKRYYFRHETPLSFHNFLRFFLLPGTFCYYFLILTELDAFHEMYPRTSFWALLIGALIALIPMVLCLTAFIGSFKFRKYSFVCIHILYWGSFLCCLLFAEAPSTIAALFWAVIVTVYYHKRKPLFFPELIPDELMLSDDEDGHIEIGEE
jgi:hypothetical protein